VLLPDLVGSSTEVATTLTTGSTGEVAGAVYVAGAPLAVFVGLMVPQTGEQVTPFCCRLQVTPWLVPSFVTVAVTCCVIVKGTVAGLGDAETWIGGMVISASALRVPPLATTKSFGSHAPLGK